MPTSPKDAKRFLERLELLKEVPFAEVLALFADKRGKTRRDSASALLNHLWVEDLFVLVDQDGASVSWNDDQPWARPDLHTLRFVGFAGKDANLASQRSDRIDPSDLNEIVPGYVWAGLIRRDSLRIVGDPAGATGMAERLRAFTHRFALELVAGRHEALAGRFSLRAAKGQTLSTMLERIANIEAEYGPFEWFDHVSVVKVFVGDVSGVGEAIAHMDLPKGVRRDEQRGQTEFTIASVTTPDGGTIYEYSIQLDVIEEEGRLRVIDARVFSGC